MSGIYRPENPPTSNFQAQIDLVDEVLKWADVERVEKVPNYYVLLRFRSLLSII